MPEPEGIKDILIGNRLRGISGSRNGLEVLKNNWDSIAGERIAEKTEPTRISRGVLHVRAESPSWASELGMRTEEVLYKTRKLLGQKAPGRIRIRTSAARKAGD